MKLTCHSEYGSLQSVYLSHPRDGFKSQQKITQEWEVLNFLFEPDYKKALQEYEYFVNLISKVASEIKYFRSTKDLAIDSIYCRDASIATDYGMILCNMGKPARRGEPHSQEESFITNHLPILGTISGKGTIEGGDVAWLDASTLAVGRGYRSNQDGFEQLTALLAPFDIKLIQVDLPHYKGPGDVFHLMSIFSPVDKDLAVVYSPLMSVAFRTYLLDNGFELVEVPESEFETMGCNVLALGPRKCLMTEGNPITGDRLREKGCEVFEYAGREISLAGGGGPTCLTRPIERML